MYEPLGSVTLKTGETVDCGVVQGVDSVWMERLADFLGHKGDPWDWQVTQNLRSEDPGVGVEVRFYILHRGGMPLSNIMVATIDGVGILGHVLTKPEDRRKHATTLLMSRQMAHFRDQCRGRALYLGTDYDSPAYHIYRGQGFVELEPGSGMMDYYCGTGGRAVFEKEYFGQRSDATAIEPVDWRHWATSPPLFCAMFDGAGGVVRMAGPQLIGRMTTERSILFLIRLNLQAAQRGGGPVALALRNTRTGAVVGLASWQWDPIWPGTLMLDVYCHPYHWDKAGDLLARLTLPKSARRIIAYADTLCPAKTQALQQAGYQATQTLTRHVPSDAAWSRMVDVVMMEKTPSSDFP